MNCPRCQQTIREGARFCDSCGFSVGSLAASEQPPPAFAETLNTDPLVGHTLDNKYELVEQLGRGGMGVVYRAVRVLVGDEVAVKILRSDFVAEPEAVARFRREARAAARIRHPNVVVIYDYGEAGGDDAPAFIVMELLKGESLRGLLKREKRLEPSRVVALMRGICAGIGLAHRNNIVHRDIKPDNVIVLPPSEEEGREVETVKVVDFGIAKLRDPAGGGTLTQKGFQPGTVHYMSPEQCRGDDLDARSDVYSLGALCYEMLAGTPPFRAESRTGVISKHLFDPPPPFPETLGVPPALAAVVMRALSKEPAERQADAAALSRELQAAEQEDREAQQRAAEQQQREAEARRKQQEEAERKQQATAAQLKEEEERKQRSAVAAPSRPPEAEAAANQRAATAKPTPTPKPQAPAPAKPTVKTPPAARTPTPPVSSAKQAVREAAVKPQSGGRRKLLIAIVLLLLGTGAVAVGLYLRVQRQAGPSSAGSETASSRQNVGTASNKQSEGPASKTLSQTPPAGMVFVPGGTFTMGRNGRDGGDEYERPAHQVTVKPFFMDTYEVTNEEYAKFVNETNHQPPPTWTNKTYPAGDEHKPVTGVTWDDARAYANWAGKRLPTEEEWEFAARGTDGRHYPWGNDWRAGEANADNASGGMADVGTYKGASPFGAFDLVGNAWEWTDTELKAYPGGQLPEKPASNAKVLRGGSYKSNQTQATATYRLGWRASGEASYAETGFRCVKDIESAPATP